MTTTAYEALAAKLVEVTAERDRAIGWAIALEQQVAEVARLRDRWQDELEERGQYDRLYTAGVVAFLNHAIDEEPTS